MAKDILPPLAFFPCKSFKFVILSNCSKISHLNVLGSLTNLIVLFPFLATIFVPRTFFLWLIGSRDTVLQRAHWTKSNLIVRFNLILFGPRTKSNSQKIAGQAKLEVWLSSIFFDFVRPSNQIEPAKNCASNKIKISIGFVSFRSSIRTQNIELSSKLGSTIVSYSKFHLRFTWRKE